PHLGAKTHQRDQETVLAIVSRRDTGDEFTVKLNHLGREVRDVLEVGVTGPQVIYRQINALAAHFLQNAMAERKVTQRYGLGDLQVDLVTVPEDRLVGAHKPTL